MKLYRYSPIKSIEELGKAVDYVHMACMDLCYNSFQTYFPVAGNIGIFCHYDDEYERLTEFRKVLTKPSDNPNQKYFELIEPINVPAHGDVPAAVYTYLYIRKPDIYRPQVGDIDFYLRQDDYDKYKQMLQDGHTIKGARIFPRNDLDMIELYDPDVDALGYVSTKAMTQKVHLKLSNETNL